MSRTVAPFVSRLDRLLHGRRKLIQLQVLVGVCRHRHAYRNRQSPNRLPERPHRRPPTIQSRASRRRGKPEQNCAGGCPTGRASRVYLTRGEPMPSQKYLLLHRSPTDNQQPPSPAQMQEMFAAFNAWKEKFKDNIVDMGGKLEAERQGAERVGRDGRALRGGQGDRRRIHDRHRRELRGRARGGAGNPGHVDAGDAHRDPGDWPAPERPTAASREHFFRHEYGRLVATLTRVVGLAAPRGRRRRRADRVHDGAGRVGATASQTIRARGCIAWPTTA